MSKILGRSGTSLADVYDVEGSEAGLEQLDTRVVTPFHEMGGTILSERMTGGIRRTSTGDILQSTTWDIVITGIAATPGARILGITIMTDVPARVNIASVLLRDPDDNRELPLWWWDQSTDIDSDIRIADEAAAANINILQPVNPTGTLPTFMIRPSPRGTPSGLSEIAFRGLTAGFGAGTVEVIVIIATLAPSGEVVPSSEGLPWPSW